MPLIANLFSVFVFRPSSSTPLFSYEVDDVVAACFVPQPDDDVSWMKKSSLYMVTKNAVSSKSHVEVCRSTYIGVIRPVPTPRVKYTW